MDRIPVQSMPSAPLGATGLSTLHSLQKAGKNPAKARQNLAQVCAETEGLFLNQLLEQMRKTFVTSTDSRQKRTDYYQLYGQQVAQALAAGGGLGLARRLFEDLQGRIPATGKENQDESSRNASPSGDPTPAGDLPVPGTPGMSGAGIPSPGGSPGGDYPEPGHI